MPLPVDMPLKSKDPHGNALICLLKETLIQTQAQ